MRNFVFALLVFFSGMAQQVSANTTSYFEVEFDITNASSTCAGGYNGVASCTLTYGNLLNTETYRGKITIRNSDPTSPLAVDFTKNWSFNENVPVSFTCIIIGVQPCHTKSITTGSNSGLIASFNYSTNTGSVFFSGYNQSQIWSFGGATSLQDDQGDVYQNFSATISNAEGGVASNVPLPASAFLLGLGIIVLFRHKGRA